MWRFYQLVLTIIGHCVIPVNCEVYNNCSIKETGPFLANSCSFELGFEIFKCPNSNVTFGAFSQYSYALRGKINLVTRLCPNDSAGYQACIARFLFQKLFPYKGFRIRLFDSPPVCGRLCWNAKEHAVQFTDDQYCPTDQRLDSNYSYTVPRLPQYSFPIRPNHVCDGKCDYGFEDFHNVHWRCVDELDCNGLSYGAVTESGIFPLTVIFYKDDNVKDLMQFEKTCPEKDEFKFPLNNRTRCFYLPRHYESVGVSVDAGNRQYQPYCTNGHDQTNCSYSGFVAGKCMVDGFPTTISTHILCVGDMPILCDDKLDGKCFTTDRHCRVHKHRLCDGHSDCKSGADEKLGACSRLSKKWCKRRMTQVTSSLPIPYDWVQDGMVDCVGGHDEDFSWERCGTGSTNRVQRGGECRDVFLCRPEEALNYLELDDVCATAATCGGKACRNSHSGVTRSAFTETVEGNYRIIQSGWCHKGLESFRKRIGETCTEKDFIHPFHEFEGKTLTTRLTVTKLQSDCRYFFGKQYVLKSCSGQCQNAKCPLKNPILHSSCGNIKNIQYSIAQPGVTVIEKDRYGYQNNFFACNNYICLPFSKVCDLADDCGDGSDEGNCENSVKCKESSRYLAVSQMCDGTVDCPDFSDECNSVCHRKSIENTGIMVCATTMGVIGTVLSLVQIFKSLFWDEPPKTDSTFVNKVFSTLIALGDFLTSSYLLILVAFHWGYQNSFCEKQLAWSASSSSRELHVVCDTGGPRISIRSSRRKYSLW
eukprot:sb/3462348/